MKIAPPFERYNRAVVDRASGYGIWPWLLRNCNTHPLCRRWARWLLDPDIRD